MKRTYIAIDLKSFYASVECVLRHLDPLTTNLVVADSSRTEKTICLAVSPSLKAYGIAGRARLFEVVQKVKEINQERLAEAVRMKAVPKDENGNYQISDGNGNYLVRNSTEEWSSLQTFSIQESNAQDVYAQLRLCFPEDSDNDCHCIPEEPVRL